MRPNEAKIVHLLRTAARLIRRADTPSISDGHRLSETNRPARCARCAGAWPCATERHARKFETALAEIRAVHAEYGEPLAAQVKRVRQAPAVIEALDAIANGRRLGVESLDYSAAVRAVLRAAAGEIA